MNILLAKKEDASDIANIHKQEIKEGFLSSLPLPFLVAFYEALIACDNSFCLIAKEGTEIRGFISGVLRINSFYTYFLQHYFLKSLSILLPKILSFSFIKKAFETLLYPQKMEQLPPAELLTMAVKKEFQGQGIGAQLLQACVSEFKKRQVAVFKVLVGKTLRSVAFYKKHGFMQVREVNIHGKDQSLVLSYSII